MNECKHLKRVSLSTVHEHLHHVVNITHICKTRNVALAASSFPVTASAPRFPTHTPERKSRSGCRKSNPNLPLTTSAIVPGTHTNSSRSATVYTRTYSLTIVVKLADMVLMLIIFIKA